jgi:hypothetical protein
LMTNGNPLHDNSCLRGMKIDECFNCCLLCCADSEDPKFMIAVLLSVVN